MKITNKLALPQSIVDCVKNDLRPPEGNIYHVTELLNPIRVIILERKHWAEMESDVSDHVPAMLGTAVHSMLEALAPEGSSAEVELSLSTPYGKVTGRADLVEGNTIVDYKTCSAGKISREDFEDWKLQGLMYAKMMFESTGTIIRKLRFIALIKDWSKVKAANSADYPQSGIYAWEYNVSDSDYDYISKWMLDRLKSINYYITSGNLPECDDAERWYTGTVYAVYKEGQNSKAVKLCDTQIEAEGYIQIKLGGKGYIITRPGENLRCKYYCDCSNHCQRYKQEVQK